MTSESGWEDGLHEGVLLVEGTRVSWLNRSAADLLGLERERALGAPLIAVVRDHRLERVVFEQVEDEVVVAGRTLLARPVAGGMTLLDVSAARRASEDARSLLAVLSHELRTPVTTVRSALEALRADLGSEQRERFLFLAETECSRLVRLIEDLTVETVPPRERRLELLQLVRRAERILKGRFENRGITVVNDIPGPDRFPGLVWADEDKLLQVLINLLENAAIHGPAGGRVTVSAFNGGGGGGEVSVTVRDEGTPLSGVADLFEPYDTASAGETSSPSSGSGGSDLRDYRSSGPGSRNDGSHGSAKRRRGSGKGSGLGLYIVRSIVERWGGRVWATPLPAGNEFGFTVPLRPGIDQPDQASS